MKKIHKEIFTDLNGSDLLKKYGINLETINKYIKKYDLILPLQAELKIANTNSSREDYVKNIEGINVEDYNEMVKCICENYPDYKDYILEQRETTRRYFLIYSL